MVAAAHMTGMTLTLTRNKDVHQPGNPGAFASQGLNPPEVTLARDSIPALVLRSDLPAGVEVTPHTRVLALCEYGPHHLTVIDTVVPGGYVVFSDSVAAVFVADEFGPGEVFLSRAARAFDEALASRMEGLLGQVPSLDGALRAQIETVRSRRDVPRAYSHQPHQEMTLF